MPENHLIEKTHSIGCSYAGKWPPDFSHLSSLGFDKLEVNSSFAVVKKVQSHDFAGRPRLFVEIRLNKSEIQLSYSCLKGTDDGLRRLHATLFLLRVLRLLPKVRASAAELSEYLLPSLEISSDVATQPYESLQKKLRDLQADYEAVCSQKSRMVRLSEAEAKKSLKLESELEALQGRVRKLEAVSDAVLCESLLSWIRVHRGELGLAGFSEANKIQLARCEEGLEILLKDGAIVEISSGNFSQARKHTPRQFSFSQRFDLGSFLRERK